MYACMSYILFMYIHTYMQPCAHDKRFCSAVKARSCKRGLPGVEAQHLLICK